MENQFKNCFPDWPIDKLLNIFFQASQFYEKNITTGEVTTSYYSGSRLIAQRKGIDPSYTLNYVLQDSLGSTIGTLDSVGNLVNTTVYAAFGGMSYTSSTLPTDKTFTGQRLDSTGLYYYEARYYDPAIPIRGDEQGLSFLPINRDGIRKMRRRISRFISADTIVQSPANPQTLNRYSYCLNNPLRFMDPSGHTVTIYGTNVQTIDAYSAVRMYYQDAGLESLATSTMYRAYTIVSGIIPEMFSALEQSSDVIDVRYESMSNGNPAGRCV